MGVSGLATGFGAIRLVLLARQAASGGSFYRTIFWMAVGVVPRTLGVSALAAVIGRRVATRASFRR